jgi:hypothetical protein
VIGEPADYYGKLFNPQEFGQRSLTLQEAIVILASSQLSVGNSKALFNAGTLRHDFVGKQILQADVLKVDQDQLAA